MKLNFMMHGRGALTKMAYYTSTLDIYGVFGPTNIYMGKSLLSLLSI